MWMALIPVVIGLTLSPTADEQPEMIPMTVPLTSRGFERIDRDQGVDVYQHKGSEIIRIAAEGLIAAPPDKVRKTLLEYERHPANLDSVAVSRVLSRADHRLVVYQRLDLPLISDRDFNLLVSWGERDKLRWIHYQVSPRGIGPRPGVVRVPFHSGSWQLVPIRGGQASRARYQSSIDLAGMLPRWMARSSVGDEVPELFAAVRRMVAAAR